MRQIDPIDDTDLPPRDGTLPPYNPPATTEVKKKSKAPLIFLAIALAAALLALVNQ